MGVHVGFEKLFDRDVVGKNPKLSFISFPIFGNIQGYSLLL